MSKVVGLTGGVSASAMQPNKDVIECCEKLLDEAKAGRMQHIAAVFGDGTHPPADCYAGSGEVAHVMMIIGGLVVCQMTLADQCMGSGK